MPFLRVRARDDGRSSSSRGFTLVELMVTLVVLAVIMVALMAILYGASHSKIATQDRLEASQSARTALDMIAGDLRSAGFGADQTTSPAQPAIAYIDSSEVILSGDFTPYPDTSSTTRSPVAYDPAGSPRPKTIDGNAWAPPMKYHTGAELVRWTLDVNNDGVVNASDQTDPNAAVVQVTRNPNDYLLVRQVYGDSTNNTAGNNGGGRQNIALVSKPGGSVPPMFTVYLKGSNTPYDWANGAVPVASLPNIDRIVVQVTAPSPRPDARGNYASTTLTTEVNSLRNAPNVGPQKYLVSGVVYNDANKNHVKDAGEPGLANVSVRLGNVYNTTTDASGNFSFQAIAGSYGLRHTANPGYGNFNSPDSFAVTLPPAGSAYAFADTARQGGWIHANAFEDTNLNGIWDNGESGVQGVSMYLNIGAQTGVTGASGLDSLFCAPFAYTVTATPPDSYAVVGTNPVSGTMTNGGTATFNFALKKSSNGTVKGTVFSDVNRNGAMDGTDTGKQGVWVGVIGSDGSTVLGWQYTDASGKYSIDVPANDPPHTAAYQVTFIPPIGNFPTTATAIANIYVQVGQVLTGNDFGVDSYQKIQLTAARVLSLTCADFIEKDWNGNQTGNRAGDTDLVLGADANATDQVSVWFNQYNGSPLFKSAPDYTRTAGASVMAIAADTLDSGAGVFQNIRPDLVTGTKYVAAGNFNVWLNGNAGAEGTLPTNPTRTYKTADNGDVQALVTGDMTGASAAADAVDILVGTKSPTLGTGTMELWQSSGGSAPTWSRTETYPPVGAPYAMGEVTAMVRADIDKDGKPDLVVTTKTGTYSGQILFYKFAGKTSSPRFTYMGKINVDNDLPNALVVTDVDSDGTLDVVIGTQNAVNTGRLLYYRCMVASTFTFVATKAVNVTGPVQTMAAVDLGGTGRNDIIVGWRQDNSSYNGGVLVYYTDTGTIPDTGTDPSGGSITNWAAAVTTGNFNYGIRPAWVGTILNDFAVGVKSGPSTGALWVFIR